MNTSSNDKKAHNKKAYSKRFVLLLLIGALVSGYLLYIHTSVLSGAKLDMPLCSASSGFDCASVARSSYSELFGIPVASYALFFYLVLFGVTILARREDEESAQSYGDFMVFTSSVAMLVTLLMAYLSLFVIKAACAYCVVLYLDNLALFVVALYNSERSKSFLSSLSLGALAPLRYLRRALRADAPDKNFAVLSVASVSALALCIYFMPEALAMWVIPKVASVTNPVVADEELEAHYRAWQNVPALDIEVHEGGADERDFTLGNRDAKVVIVEFSDFECPFCQQINKRIKPVLEEFKDDTRFVFKNYPLDKKCNDTMRRGGHKFACEAAAMARCAGAQGDEKFWKMADALFALVWFSQDALEALPDKVGVDKDTFYSCLADQRVDARIRKDIELGIKLAVRGTPTFFINGKRLASLPLNKTTDVLRYIIRRNLEE